MTTARDDRPRVSVIIPVRDRRDLLGEALDALDAQTFRDFEVLVVDDGSTDGSRELAEGSTVAGRPVTVLDNPGRGAIEARQFGVDRSSAPLLAFTDSDCRPDPAWLAELTAAADRGADLVAGVTVPARQPKPLERSMISTSDDGRYPTCNVLYRRTWVERVGGFATNATHELTFDGGSVARHNGYWEDTLMAWRLRRAGAKAAFVPTAVVVHHVFPPDIGELLRRSWMLGSQPRLFGAVPELRQTLLADRRIFQERKRALVYLIAVGLLAGRPRIAILGFVGWAAARLRWHRRSGVELADAVAALPVELLADLVHSAALVRGSIAARTLVL